MRGEEPVSSPLICVQAFLPPGLPSVTRMNTGVDPSGNTRSACRMTESNYAAVDRESEAPVARVLVACAWNAAQTVRGSITDVAANMPERGPQAPSNRQERGIKPD